MYWASACCLEYPKKWKVYPIGWNLAFVQKAVFALVEQSTCFCGI